MGELFRRRAPDQTLAWTGERLVTEVHGQIEDEHLHRYLLARELCRGKRVLDIASGEGYGSSLLAQTALRVTGVEIDAATVEHASRAYAAENLEFRKGTAISIPLDDQSVDVVVSFETLEHFFEQDTFFREIRRVLAPQGVLVISTPDADVYTSANGEPNPYHIRELTKSDFRSLLGSSFDNVSLYRQRFLVGSAIMPDECSPGERADQNFIYEQRDHATFEGHRLLPRAPYLVAMASNRTLKPIAHSLYVSLGIAEAKENERDKQREREEEKDKLHQQVVSRLKADAAAAIDRVEQTTRAMEAEKQELARLRAVEESIREQSPKIARSMAEGDAAKHQLEQAQDRITQLQTEADRLNRSMFEQTPLLARAMAEGEAARDQARTAQGRVMDLEAEVHRLQALQIECRSEITKLQTEAAAKAQIEERFGETIEKLQVGMEELRKATEEAWANAAAAEEARLTALAAEAMRLEAVAAEQARLREAAADEARLQAATAEEARFKAAAGEVNKGADWVQQETLNEFRQDLVMKNQELENARLLIRQQAIAMLRLQRQIQIPTASIEVDTREAEQKAQQAEQKAQQAEQKAQQAEQKAQQAEQKTQQAEQKTQQAEQRTQQTEQKARDAEQRARQADFVREREVQVVREELARLRGVVAEKEKLCSELAGLVIPVWMRKLLPQGLRSSVRAMKRSLKA